MLKASRFASSNSWREEDKGRRNIFQSSIIKELVVSYSQKATGSPALKEEKAKFILVCASLSLIPLKHHQSDDDFSQHRAFSKLVKIF